MNTQVLPTHSAVTTDVATTTKTEVLVEAFSPALGRNAQVRLLTYPNGTQDMVCLSGTDETHYAKAKALLGERGLTLGPPDKDWLTGVYYSVTKTDSRETPAPTLQ